MVKNWNESVIVCFINKIGVIFYFKFKVGIDVVRYILNKLLCFVICLKLVGCFGIIKKRLRLFNFG